MSFKKIIPFLFAAALCMPIAELSAQQASPASAPVRVYTEASGRTLRIQLTISRFQGEKKLGSLPYTLVVTPASASGGTMTRIRLGVDAPVQPAGSGEKSKDGAAQSRTVGTNIDCYNVKELSASRFQFEINLQSTAALAAADGGVTNSADLPLLRRFDATFMSVLNDGQSMQVISSTDPVTGEVVKVDVTLNVLK